MRAPRLSITFLLVAIFCASSSAAQKNSPELQQRADQASGKDCAHLSMQTAHQLLEDANRLFSTGDVKPAHQAIDESLRYARRSVDCSLQSRKGEKVAEIELRKLIRRMKDVQRTLDSDDRPHLSQTLTELEKQRDRLLHGMFGAAAGGATPERKP
jgi:uncharacterized membrane protein YccC